MYGAKTLEMEIAATENMKKVQSNLLLNLMRQVI